jgi:tetratricopeptide (TPR) repeat protein
MSKCARSGCHKEGVNRCSTCLREPYCCGDCQKIDWKSHKLICKTLKKLPHEFQSYRKVIQVITEVQEDHLQQNTLDIRVLGHLLSYAEFQFGDRVLGRAHRERANGESISNWTVDILTLFPICVSLTMSDNSLTVIVRNQTTLPYWEKIADLLKPWSAYLDSNFTNRIDNLNRDQINVIAQLLSMTERNTASIYVQSNQCDMAEIYCQRALSYARLYEGKEEEKAEVLSKALQTFYELHGTQGNYTAALPFAEEAYNVVAMAYNPVHPKVQEAAATLIECLCNKGDLYDAERFAQASLDSLKDPANKINQESEEVARGYHALARIIRKQEGDLVRAEMLIRESLRIRVQIHGANHHFTGLSYGLLGTILQSQNKLDNETKELLVHAHSINKNDYGPDGYNTAVSTVNLGNYYHLLSEDIQTLESKVKNLHLSKSYFKEALRIETKIFGPNNSRTKELADLISFISYKLSEG